MKTISRYIMTLALLLTAVTGAWAADTYTITFSGFGNEACNKTVTDATLEYSETFNVADVDANYMQLNYVGGSNDYVSISTSQETQITITVKSAFEGTVNVTVYYLNGEGDEAERNISVTCVKSAPAITVEWDAATKTGTFAMPGSDVVLTPIYAAATIYDANQTEKGSYETFKEAFLAAQNGDIIKLDGDVTVTSATDLMTSNRATEDPVQFTIDFNGHVLDGSSVTTFMNTEHDGDQITFIDSSTGEVGGLKGMVSGKKNSFVFAGGRYSFNGLTAAEIESQWSTSLAANGWAMAEGKKFVDLEGAPDANGFMVGIGLADYDISFRAANANTIEAGKATVTIDGAAATLTEGKVTGVKMGQQVKMTAAQGYKFRKVEAKKGGAEVSITVGNVTLLVTGCTTWEQVIAKNSDKIRKSRSDDVETVDGSAFLRKGTDIVKITHTVDPNATDYNWYEM